MTATSSVLLSVSATTLSITQTVPTSSSTSGKWICISTQHMVHAFIPQQGRFVMYVIKFCTAGVISYKVHGPYMVIEWLFVEEK